MFKFKKNFLIFTSTFLTSLIATQALGGVWGNAAQIEKYITTSEVKYDLNNDGIINTTNLNKGAANFNVQHL